MPLHDFRCTYCGAVEERHVPSDNLSQLQWHKCGEVSAPMEKVFLKAPVGFVQRDICYDSPVDGRPITSKQARIEDLRRNDCVEYDPGMKQDAERARREAEARLDRALDETVEAAIAVLDTRSREKLDSELRSGADVELVRGTPTIN